jgi:hypothetical protein
MWDEGEPALEFVKKAGRINGSVIGHKHRKKERQVVG